LSDQQALGFFPEVKGCNKIPADSKILFEEAKAVDLETSPKLLEIRAPMSGVFYCRPAPEQPPYVQEGDPVKKKQVVGLLETMKVFQKVKSPGDGRVVNIVAKNETALKDGDLIMVIAGA
jgi:biotin carboxyl carrier protein